MRSGESDLLSKTLEAAERRGFTVSVHPTKTAVIRNYREYALLFPQEDGSVIYEVREPLYEPHIRGQTVSELELHGIIKELT